MRISPYRVLARYNDLKAIRKGPEAAAKRLVRRQVHKQAHKAARSFLKTLGL